MEKYTHSGESTLSCHGCVYPWSSNTGRYETLTQPLHFETEVKVMNLIKDDNTKIRPFSSIWRFRSIISFDVLNCNSESRVVSAHYTPVSYSLWFIRYSN